MFPIDRVPDGSSIHPAGGQPAWTPPPPAVQQGPLPSPEGLSAIPSAGAVALALAGRSGPELHTLSEGLGGLIQEAGRVEDGCLERLLFAEPSQAGVIEAERGVHAARREHLQALQERVDIAAANSVLPEFSLERRDPAEADRRIEFRLAQVAVASLHQNYVQARTDLQAARAPGAPNAADAPHLEEAVHAAGAQLDAFIHMQEVLGLMRNAQAAKAEVVSFLRAGHSSGEPVRPEMIKACLQRLNVMHLTQDMLGCYPQMRGANEGPVQNLQVDLQGEVQKSALRDALFDQAITAFRVQYQLGQARAEGTIGGAAHDEAAVQALQGMIDAVVHGALLPYSTAVDAEAATPGLGLNPSARQAIINGDNALMRAGPSVQAAVSAVEVGSLLSEPFHTMQRDVQTLGERLRFTPGQAEPDPQSALVRFTADVSTYAPFVADRPADERRQLAVENMLTAGAEDRFAVHRSLVAV